MNASRHLVLQTTSGGLGRLFFCVGLICCALGQVDRADAQVASAQTATTVGPPSAPSLNAELSTLPSSGALTLGQWILTPTLGLYTLYDSNVHSSPTNPMAGPGFHFHPTILADYNTGIYDTQLYANLDSIVYPTLNYTNNTLDGQAGFTEKYSPLPDLLFTAQGNYNHATNANVLQTSIPNPITAPGSPPAPGSAGVVAIQQTVYNPNDLYTGTASVLKQFSHGSVTLGGTVETTQYEQNPSQNYSNSSYNGSGNFYVTPVFYAFGDGIQSFINPATGPGSNYFRARAGIGTAQIGLFSGYVYYGQQGSEVNGDGKAGGDIYGGGINYFPTDPWNMTFSVDRLRNVSNITAGAPLALGGLPFVPVGVSAGTSLETTTLTFKSDYTFTPQTSAHAVVSYTLGQAISGPSFNDTTWLVDVGIRHQLRDNLAMTFDYQYSDFVSPTPLSGFTRNVVTIGGNYTF